MLLDRPLTVSDAARILSVSEETVRALERRGVLTAIRTPSGVRIFSAPEVERLAEERAQARARRNRGAP